MGNNGDKLVTAKVLLDIIVVLLDITFDYLLVKDLYGDGHYRWAVAAFCVTFLPGMTTAIAMRAEAPPKTLTDNLRNLTYMLFYPFWICWLGWRTVQEPSKLHLMLHLKSYEGLMEASFQFLIQIIIFFSRTAVGHIKVFGFIIPNGDFWWRNFNIFLSLMSFTWGVCNYHCLLDKNLGFRAALKVMPYFLVNFLFRTITIALLFVYIKLPYIILLYVVFAMLGLTNIYLTHHTMNKNNERSSHLMFTCIVGGIISILTPAMGSFYAEGKCGKTVRKYYKINTIVTNTVLGLSFTGLVIFLNSSPSPHYLNQFPLIGCHEPNHTWTWKEFGFYETPDSCNVSIKSDFPLLGGKWEVRGKKKCPKNETTITSTLAPFSIKGSTPHPKLDNKSRQTRSGNTNHPRKDTKPNFPPGKSALSVTTPIPKKKMSGPTSNSTTTTLFSNNAIDSRNSSSQSFEDDTSYFLVAQECGEHQKAIDYFNMVVIPVVVALGILSTLSAFSMKKWNIVYQHEDIDNMYMEEYNY